MDTNKPNGTNDLGVCEVQLQSLVRALSLLRKQESRTGWLDFRFRGNDIIKSMAYLLQDLMTILTKRFIRAIHQFVIFVINYGAEEVGVGEGIGVAGEALVAACALRRRT